jgi:hypothetical protein
MSKVVNGGLGGRQGAWIAVAVPWSTVSSHESPAQVCELKSSLAHCSAVHIGTPCPQGPQT